MASVSIHASPGDYVGTAEGNASARRRRGNGVTGAELWVNFILLFSCTDSRKKGFIKEA